MTNGKTASAITTTWMCAHGHHGTTERRYSTFSNTGVPKSEGMYTGKCAGSCVRLRDDNSGYDQFDCGCACHDS